MLGCCTTTSYFHSVLWFLILMSSSPSDECMGNTTGRDSDQIKMTDTEAGSLPGQEVEHGIADAAPTSFEEQAPSLRWIAFAPTGWDPEKGVRPSLQSLKEDLRVLRQAGFDALVTYGADILGPQIAAEMKFRGMIIGVWDPQSKDELERAKAAAADNIVIGLAVGNEGLDVRYDYETLKRVIEELKAATGKPVTTSEQIGDYQEQRLVELGDWIFPIVHPYWHRILNPKDAVEWTELQYRHLIAEVPDRFVFLKEVGLPSGGDPNLSEANQAEYYKRLQKTHVLFCWFESYDQPWKGRTHPIESHWGLFRSDRASKEVINFVPKGK